MSTYEQMPSIKTAVEQEERRRKRVFATFLALLLIPVAIGAYAILKAPSETDAVVARVTPIVEETVAQTVDRKIEPRVEEIVERRAVPVIERSLDKTVRFHMGQDKGRIDALERRIELLEQQLQELKTRPRPADVKLDVPLTHVPKPVPQ